MVSRDKYWCESWSWKPFNILPFIATTDTKLIWFKYKIIYRILSTNTFLQKIDRSQSDICSFCRSNRETIKHLLCDCTVSKGFWQEFRIWINEQLNFELQITDIDIILGKLKTKEKPIINLLILLGKYFIYKQKFKNSRPTINIFKLEVKYYYKLEKYIYSKNNKEFFFSRRWKPFETFCENWTII